MRAFVSTEPHVSTMARLGDWCDEATFANRDQATEDLPDWQTATAACRRRPASDSHTPRMHIRRAPSRRLSRLIEYGPVAAPCGAADCMRHRTPARLIRGGAR
jgi:hypothetical protein